jgi:hypothetical protein
MCDFRQPPPYIILPTGERIEDPWMGRVPLTPQGKEKWGFGHKDVDYFQLKPGLYYMAHGYEYWDGKTWIGPNPWVDERQVTHPIWTCPDWDDNDEC